MSIQPVGDAGRSPGLAMAGPVAAAAALLNRPAETADLRAQLEAYSALAGHWPQASERDRPAAARALSESAFAHRIQATLNAFTRAAWAGPDATPPAPEKQMLAAFDALAAPDQQIIAALRGGPLGVFPLTSPADYRARLRSELDAAAGVDAAPERRPDIVTLSDAARSGVGEPVPLAAPPQPRSAQMAAALAVYERTAG